MKGHVRKHAGKWYCVIFQGRRLNGHGKLGDTHKWVGGFETEDLAEGELVRQLSARLQGTHVEPSRLTFEDYLKGWLSVKKSATSPKTFEGYSGLCSRHIIPSLGSIPLQKLGPFDLEGFYGKLLTTGRRPRRGEKKPATRGLSARTVLHAHRLIHKVLGDAVRKKLISNNAADAAIPPRPEFREMSVLDETATVALITEARRDERLWLPVVLGAATGMRRGEICGLRWRDLNVGTNTLTVTRSLSQTKADGLIFKDLKRTRSRRAIVLPQFAMDALEETRSQQRENRALFGRDYRDNDLIVALPDGRPVPPNDLSATFARFRKSLGLSTRFHDLRHGHASQALRNGLSIKVVQGRLGHASAAFTLGTYSHLSIADDARAADAFQDVLGEALKKHQNTPVN